MPRPNANTRLFWSVTLGWVALDILTKHLALEYLTPGTPVPVLGDVARFTLAFNRGAAMGLSLGAWSRPAFTVIGLLMLAVLWSIYRSMPPERRVRIVLLALITGGAVGNLIDRVRWSNGVVDFIDVGVGSTRFWTFNVADMGISVSAILLALIWGREGKEATQPD
ncbi:MAG: signal peptidase II [Gemmatimonadales bacterium]|nr:MAG: signal peptidase II [Gemmatimonadales bacterium]